MIDKQLPDETPNIMPESFQAWKDTLPKEPEGDVKKNFSVISVDEDAWKYIHELLIADGTSEQYIPSEAITCIEEQKHSKTRSIYLLTPTEVAEIKKHPKIKSVNISYKSYPGTYKLDPKSIYAYNKPNRYDRNGTKTVKNYRDNAGSYLPSSPSESDVNRCGFQLLRTSQKNNPWSGISDDSVITESISYYGDGTDVDVIIVDDACQFMHSEFVNTGIGTHNYVPGNVLNNPVINATYGPPLVTTAPVSTAKGTCGVLDLLIDAPYYIDPSYFLADASNRLLIRWDGTITTKVPAAKGWWTSSSNRSSTSIMGGTTVDLSDTGGLLDYYNRTNVCGGFDITSYQTFLETHGTSCAAMAYGRTHGWAFNANKWFVSNTYVDLEDIFDMIKLFHKYKPNRSLDDTKNPTIVSNSYVYSLPVEASGVYHYQKNTSGYLNRLFLNSSDTPATPGYGVWTVNGIHVGTPGVIVYKDHPFRDNWKLKYVAYNKNADSSIGGLTDGNEYWVGKLDDDSFYLSETRGTGSFSPPSNTRIAFTSKGVGKQTFGMVSQPIYNGSAWVDTALPASGVTYSGITYNSDTTPKFMSNFYKAINPPTDNRASILMEMVENSMTTAGEELIDEGVIFACAAGNGHQTLVKGDHPNYNNYWNTGTDLNKSLNETSFNLGQFDYYKTVNRPGFPAQIGKKWDGVAGVTTYRTISISSLSNQHYTSGSSTYERVSTYSNIGNFVSCFAPGEGTIAANALGPAAGSNVGVGTYARYDDSYTIGSNTSVDWKDRIFGGTSASCPLAVGLIATKLQYQRNWSYDQVKFWIESIPQSTSLYYGTDADSVDSSNWACNVCLNGASQKIIFDQQTMAEYGPLQSGVKLRISGSNLTIDGGDDGLSIKSG